MWRWFVLTWLGGLVAGCSLLLPLDPAPDGSAPDHATGDLAADSRTTDSALDTRADGKTRPDGKTALDSKTTPDGKTALDSKLTPDSKVMSGVSLLSGMAKSDVVPIPDAPPVVDIGPAPDGPQTFCTQDTQCTVFEDCCDCRAEYVWITSPFCNMACAVKACTTEAGIKQPKAYCLKGQCLLAENAVGCTADKDCKKVDDCCYCMAVPTSTTPQTCPNTCFVNTCTGIGLQAATAKCVSGTCRLVP